MKRINTVGRIAGAGGIAEKRSNPNGCVAVRSVVHERIRSNGRVAGASAVEHNAAAPIAVLESPLLKINAPPPTAVLKLPVESLKSAYQPRPVLPAPVASPARALH